MRRKEKPVVGTNIAGETAECESYMKTAAMLIMQQALIEAYVKWLWINQC
jgi:hypothetical protein